MISTRQLFNSDLEFFRRNDRGIPMPLSQHSHLQDHYETPSHLSNHPTPTAEPENRTTGGLRKRVPVACERCRKRKIKCSGNEGDNQSCANCRNAGHEDSCRFLRVSSVETGGVYQRPWQGPSRFSPYPLPSTHRLNHHPMSSRYTSQNAAQYPALASSLEPASFVSPTAPVDWTKSAYVGPYSPFPGDGESSPYASQPPPYILPNTDPMSSSTGYYVSPQGVRPQLGSLWPDGQHCLPQSTASLPSTAYIVSPEATHPFHNMQTTGTLATDRILPTPHFARGLSSFATPVTDGVIATSATRRPSTYLPSENSPNVHEVSPHVDTLTTQNQLTERGTDPYRPDAVSYAQFGLGDALSSASLPSQTALAGHDTQSSPIPTVDDEVRQQQTVSRDETNESTPEMGSVAYSYAGSFGSRNSQQRTTCSHLSTGGFYCSSTGLIDRRESAPDECSPTCSTCQTDSTQGSILSVGNTSSGY